MKLLAILSTAGLAIVNTAMAVPSLQLGMAEGDGDYINETTVARSDVFTLNAYLTPDSNNTSSDQYYISMAVTPKTGSTSQNLGYFTINGTQVNVTGDMVFGTPPLSALYPDLPDHGIFATYYKEMSFTFNGGITPDALNVQDDSKQADTLQYFQSFNIDVSGLAEGYGIHFDLYNENIKLNGDSVTKFAPPSHDAESLTHRVPDGGTTLAMLGLGLMAVDRLRRKMA